MVRHSQSEETATALRVLHAIVWSRWLLWALLAIPAVPIVVDLWWLELYYAETMYITGLFSAQLLVATLAVTPASLLLRYWEWGRGVGRWLRPRRRYFGLAAAGYAALHTAHYARYENDLGHVVREAMDTPYLAGWVAIAIFIPLAVTSNASSLRTLGRRWKPLQRLVYVATAGAFLHWWLLDQRQEEIYLWGSVLIVAKALHIMLQRSAFTRSPQNALRSPQSLS